MSAAGVLVPEPSPRDPRDLTADPERMEAENRWIEEAEAEDMAPSCCDHYADCWCGDE